MTNGTIARQTDVTPPSCHYGHMYYNYSLLYGRKAGNFTDQGEVENMSECLRICCKEVSCKIALMLARNCYSVACHGKFCQTVPVNPFQFKPRIAHVIRRKGEQGICLLYCVRRGGLVVSVLDSGARGLGSSPGRVVALCSWARLFTLTMPLSTHEYKCVPENCPENFTKYWEVTCDGLASHPGGVAILLLASFYVNRGKLRQ